VIWRQTAAQIPEAPILGAGMGAARAFHGGQGATAPLVPGTGFQLSTSLHSHNAYLQVWYEAGLVGAVLMLGLGLTVLAGLRAFPVTVQPYLAATFVGGALLMATAYSIWAPWFMGALAMTAIFAALGAILRPGETASGTAAPDPRP
jgi:O-antigen ligase